MEIISLIISVTTYPREGTETAGLRIGYRRYRVTTYPREGTETFLPGQFPIRILVTTYPREGTETRLSRNPSVSKPSQLIPARGRKQFTRNLSNEHLRHNLSPRGDGNVKSDCYFLGLLVTTYPREGTTAFSFATTVHLSVTTYPRKGTEKALSVFSERAFSCLQRVCIYVNRQKNKAAVPFRYSGLFLIRIYSTIRPCQRNRTAPSSPSR